MAATIPASRTVRTVGASVALGLLGLVWFAPLLVLVTTALRTGADLASSGTISWPGSWTLDNFADAWKIGDFSTTYRNSLLIAVVKVPLGVAVSALLAYALAKLDLRFRRSVMFFVFLGLTVPLYIAIVPLFTMLRSVYLTDTLAGLLPAYLAFGIPFTTLVLHQFFRRVPDELIEAARIDGAGDFRIFWQFMLPLALPALVTVAILDTVATWNELLIALIMLSSPENSTLPLGMLNFSGAFSTNHTGLSAGILIAVVPILVLYALLQRWIVGGLTAGAVKG
ncbi:carbohydrate ABC transporter permease [Streptomyces millisiae]|uniref:Carbohydrate ABC transporter permease n=1 Tax=Streptomyces millisiae TaxID=3075542 RepID=A0ABU2LYW2_9ACTN|nr:carbohydrate ABC transporter permease [Streptomyces sp. DSM 44918]MDT0322754.1 carbohydrate ABC transporter permease [Streptomyces sp. DSM 44918]